MADPEYLFVYGSLRLGREDTPLARKLHEEAEYVGKGKFQGRLFEIDWYPGAIDSSFPGDQVTGDIFCLGSRTKLLAELDAFEGCGANDPLPHEYVRQVRDIQTDAGPVSAWVYVYNRDVAGRRRIASGDFLEKKGASGR